MSEGSGPERLNGSGRRIGRGAFAAALVVVLFLLGAAAPARASLASFGYSVLRLLDRADIVHHDLKARLDPLRFRAEFEDDITFAGARSRTLHILLSVDASLDEVSIPGPDGAETPVDFAQTLRLGAIPYAVYRVTLPEPPDSSALTLRFRWHISPATVQFLSPFVANHYFYAGYAVLWHPSMPGEGFFEADIQVVVPERYTALAEGVRVDVAPGSPERGWTTYTFATEAPVSGMGIGAGLFHPLDPVEVDGAEIQGWRPADRLYTVDRVVNHSAEALRFLTLRLGPLSATSHHIAEFPFGYDATYSTLHGLAYGGELAAFRPFGEAGLAWIAAHEAAHKWIGGTAGVRVLGSAWLLEGLAEYLAYLVIESILPADEAAALLRERLAGPVAERTGRSARPLGAIEVFDRDGRDVFERGAMLFRMLHRRLGDQAFFDLLRAFIAEYRGRHASGAEFMQFSRSWVQAARANQRAGAEGHAGDAAPWAIREPIATLPSPSEMRAFFRTWVERSSTLDYALSGTLDTVRGEHRLVLEWESLGTAEEPGPVDVAIRLEDGRTLLKQINPGERHEIRTRVRPVEAILDPEHWLPDIRPDNNVWTPDR